MGPTQILILYAAIIVIASLVGGLVPGFLRLGHRALQLSLSLVAGIMLGVAFFHMLPHAVMLRAESTSASGHELLDPVMFWAVLGFLVLFLLVRFSHFHQHELPEVAPHQHGPHCDHGDGEADHGHHHHGGESHAPIARGGKVERSAGWAGALVGLGVHSLLEGVALGASVVVGAAHGGSQGFALAGLATFLVIALHKPFDAMTLAILMRRAHAPMRIRVLANIFLAALVPAGIGIFWASAGGRNVDTIAIIALAFSAGMFVCIASSDLLPELQFHSHDRIALSCALVLGLAFAFGLARLEAATHVHVDGSHEHHDHDHDHDHSHESGAHAH